ncbi:uncharacterized protein LOC127255370 [Andrographis paniculata]|uniref:uncharacterized protein LOC127255370 n=1 Tax=Andrographis paniculata TaxID=175694 RepID=UPI0021E871A8|nr:uncharacterized protein LOC127255370 [Andrographis paniculata]
MTLFCNLYCRLAPVCLYYLIPERRKLLLRDFYSAPLHQVTYFPWSRFSLHPPRSRTHPLFCRQMLGRLPFARWSVKILLSGTIRISCATPEAYQPVPLCFASVCIINCMSWMCLDSRFLRLCEIHME